MRISPPVAEKEIEEMLAECCCTRQGMPSEGVVMMCETRWDAIATLLAEWKEARAEVERLQGDRETLAADLKATNSSLLGTAKIQQDALVECAELREEVKRLRHAEERDLLAIEQGLDRDDTLGAAMRRQREEIERLREALKEESP